MPRLCEVYPGVRLTTEDKARKSLSQGSRRMPVGKEYTEQSILVNKKMMQFELGQDLVFVIVVMNVQIPH